MTGGDGVDVFKWGLSDLDGSIDTITDFDLSQDILNLSDVFVARGINYDPQNFSIDAFVRLQQTPDGAAIFLFDGTPVVLLSDIDGVNVDELFTGGNILL